MYVTVIVFLKGLLGVITISNLIKGYIRQLLVSIGSSKVYRRLLLKSIGLFKSNINIKLFLVPVCL